jgi:hypothetical protein
MKTYRGIDALLISALDGSVRSALRSGRFTPENDFPVVATPEAGSNPEPVCTLWRREESVPRLQIEPRFLGPAASSQSLH